MERAFTRIYDTRTLKQRVMLEKLEELSWSEERSSVKIY
jgi:hypothetical protein